MSNKLKWVLAFVSIIAGTAAFAQPQAGCVTTDCHATMGTAEWVHGPVGVGACTVCHVQVNGTDHGFALAAERDELCFGCHEAARDQMLEDYLHTPVAEGKCTACHDPHQSAYQYTLKGPAGDLCFNCHDAAGFAGDTVHGPVESGDCTACHDPHASSHPNQLNEAPGDLCLSCHEDKEGVLDLRHVHPPVAEGCTNCHVPHASEASSLLPAPMPELCWTCHPSLEGAGEASHPHPPVAEGECGACHGVHGSDHPRLLVVAGEQLCFECHTDLGDYVSAQAHKHGPVSEGDCNACHDPHGSENHVILRKPFPEEFYTGYREDKYAICFECHNHQIAMEAETRTLTDFRDGERNLHFLHVNKDVKGRSCRACHQVHASSQEKHIRLSVPYGKINWELPVTFTRTENGGSCQVGCHAPKEYVRK